ncbi:MAG: hypothetical protein GYA15_14480 [Leptolinea sp.]|jgi:hypothetical protein|nr:hypothetical protein [Leptolinea sp.]
MSRKKTHPTGETAAVSVESTAPSETRKKKETTKEEFPVQAAVISEKTVSTPESGAPEQPGYKRQWLLAVSLGIACLALGFLLSYLLQVRPLQIELASILGEQNLGEISSNQIKSDLSNTRLRQQEMEIRYLTAAARLESANQYITLLRMNDLVSKAHLLVIQKNGLEARKKLAEIRTYYNQIKPFILEKDAAIADDLDETIQSAVQDLTIDPEAAAGDMEALETHLDKVEAALFRME